MQISLNSIPKSLEIRLGLPRPDWAVIHDWVENNIAPPGLNIAWNQLANDWLRALIDALPTGYECYESPEFVLLSDFDSRQAGWLLRWCEHSRHVIMKTLTGVAQDEGYGKHVVLALSDPESYHDYILDFYPDEGEFAGSGGIFVDRGYGHIALWAADSAEHDRTIAHELTHALLSHLPLPMWLNEGVTQVVEDTVMESSYFTVDREIRQRHRTFWTPETMDEFWSGESFSRPDDGQELSYHLAQILTHNLMSDYPQQVTDILNAADRRDAGEAALLQVCGVSLNARITQFLGEGDWSPRSDYSDNSR